MLCSICHKNEAVICYTEFCNGEKKEQYLCPECAAKYTSFNAGSNSVNAGNLLSSLLTSVLGQTGNMAVPDESKKSNLVCPKCGMTYNEFLRYSKFGCPECVHTFGFLLDDYLRKIQGSCEHRGKKYGGEETVTVPDISLMTGVADSTKQAEENTGSSFSDVKAGACGEQAQMAQNAAVQETAGNKEDAQIQKLKKQLSKAIQEEEYEQAAKLRDQIRALEKKGEDTDDHVV